MSRACVCMKFCSNFGLRLLESNSYLAMLERIFQHSPEITFAKCSNTTDTRSFSKIRLPCHSTLLPTSKRAYCKQ